ncbi:helix-turn-helix domain-containing protein [Cupriavidus plantarum]|uniref:helix-turn-helix domain-containing protein n=2 Tax=Cupriavidus plantarum TaxID=942865 RepID=UPI00339D3A0C
MAERHGTTSDTELAEVIGITQPAVSQYRSGKRMPDNEVCLQIAQALAMNDPMPVIMAADMDRAERAGQRSLWEVFSKRMALATPATLAVLAVASVTNFVTPSSVQTSTGAIQAAKHHVLCQIRRRLQKALRAVQAGSKTAPA